MSNDSVKFTYYPFEALGSRRQETEKKKERKKRLKVRRLTIYSRKTKCDIFTKFTGTALYFYAEHLEQKHVSE
jgi:hypothetical protein